ncbi:MAG: hypothetical protein Q8N55_00095 [bacterium]|nr:hypothetical protein [bacterium]
MIVNIFAFLFLSFAEWLFVGCAFCTRKTLVDWKACKGFRRQPNDALIIFLGAIGWPFVLRAVRRWKKNGSPRKMIMEDQISGKF